MEKENVNVNVSCWKNEDKSTSLVEDDHVCPLCKGQAQQVKGITVEHFVSKSNIDELDKISELNMNRVDKLIARHNELTNKMQLIEGKMRKLEDDIYLEEKLFQSIDFFL